MAVSNTVDGVNNGCSCTQNMIIYHNTHNGAGHGLKGPTQKNICQHFTYYRLPYIICHCNVHHTHLQVNLYRIFCAQISFTIPHLPLLPGVLKMKKNILALLGGKRAISQFRCFSIDSIIFLY